MRARENRTEKMREGKKTKREKDYKSEIMTARDSGDIQREPRPQENGK